MLFPTLRYVIVITIILLPRLKSQIPEPKFEALWPTKGLRVSIEDTGNIKNFVFHGRLNEEMAPDGIGKEWSQNFMISINGRFTIEDYKTKIKIGDKIYYRILIGLKNLKRPDDYKTLEGLWIVNDFVYYNGTKVSRNLIDDSNFCFQSETTANGKNVCAGQLILNEDFNDTEISKDKWLKEHRYAGAPDYEFVIYNKNNTNSFIKNGVLIIKPTLLEETFGENSIENHVNLGDQCTGVQNTRDCSFTPMFGQIQKPILSARIVSKISFRFGRIHIKAKLPCGLWLYPVLYLEPKGTQYTSMTNCATFPGQMRIALTKGSDSELSAGLVRCLSVNEQVGTEDMRNILLEKREEFHEFLFEWAPEKITMAVDGTRFGEILPTRAFHSAEMLAFGSKIKTEANLILGLGVGGINHFPDGMHGKPWKNRDPKNVLHFWEAREQWWPTWCEEKGQLHIDSVKIYAL